MSKWRELKYYAHGTPTKTAMRYRRRHLFRWDTFSKREHTPCGLVVTPARFGEGPTEVQKCKHCLKAMGKK